MKVKQKRFLDIFFRYLILILVAIPNLWIFYFVFTPLTIYPVYALLNGFFDVSLLGNILVLDRTFPIEFISACIAGSAYYFLLILNLSTPNIKMKKRITMIFISFASLLALNILRIMILVGVFFLGASFFDITHIIFWYFMSIVFVVGIWFTQIKIFKIKEIPFYSDFKFLYKNLLGK
jgi:hypothetical protein|tara:strand:- start:950 stop:1483 length:534 start_codon:yes stop_codon:yes gene_type:complete